MSKINELKVEAANLFYVREQLQANMLEVNQKLQEVTNLIQEEEKKEQETTQSHQEVE
jgi:hypothetical protein